MRLEQSPDAQADLAEITAYGAENFGAMRALDYLARIEQCFRQLSDYPKSGRADPAVHPRVRSLSCGSHRIYYSIDADTITVRRILHKASDAARWLG